MQGSRSHSVAAIQSSHLGPALQSQPRRGSAPVLRGPKQPTTSSSSALPTESAKDRGRRASAAIEARVLKPWPKTGGPAEQPSTKSSISNRKFPVEAATSAARFVSTWAAADDPPLASTGPVSLPQESVTEQGPAMNQRLRQNRTAGASRAPTSEPVKPGSEDTVRGADVQEEKGRQGRGTLDLGRYARYGASVQEEVDEHDFSNNEQSGCWPERKSFGGAFSGDQRCQAEGTNIEASCSRVVVAPRASDQASKALHNPENHQGSQTEQHWEPNSGTKISYVLRYPDQQSAHSGRQNHSMEAGNSTDDRNMQQCSNSSCRESATIAPTQPYIQEILLCSSSHDGRPVTATQPASGLVDGSYSRSESRLVPGPQQISAPTQSPRSPPDQPAHVQTTGHRMKVSEGRSEEVQIGISNLPTHSSGRSLTVS